MASLDQNDTSEVMNALLTSPISPGQRGAQQPETPVGARAGEAEGREEGDGAAADGTQGEGGGEGANDEGQMDLDHDQEPQFNETGLKEIGNLASWTVSSWKPGCGIEALRDEDTNLFWQSDGPQPHHLSIHFSRFVSILAIRIYLDFEADESYTPTKITCLAGTGYHDLIPFSNLEFTRPKGWINVDLTGVGGSEAPGLNNDGIRDTAGNVLRAFLVQIKIVENHQNGKDTHVRGVKIYGRDERMLGKPMGSKLPSLFSNSPRKKTAGGKEEEKGRKKGEPVLSEPEWMGELELR